MKEEKKENQGQEKTPRMLLILCAVIIVWLCAFTVILQALAVMYQFILKVAIPNFSI